MRRNSSLFSALALGVVCISLHACGGSSPELAIDFPPPISLVDQPSTPVLTFRGRAADDGAVAEVKVGDVVAESDDGFATWQADVSLKPGKNVIEVVATDRAGSQTRKQVVVDNVTYIPRLAGAIASGASESAIYIVDDLRDAIFTLDRENGAMNLLIEEGQSSIPDPVDVEVTSNGALLVADAETKGLFKVNPDEPNPVMLSGETKGTGPLPDLVRGVGWNALEPELAYLADQLGAVFEVELASGHRRIVSAVDPDRNPDTDDNVGTGSPMVSLRDVVNDVAHGRLLVSDNVLRQLIAIDPGTGERTVFAELPYGSRSLTLNTTANRILLVLGGAEGGLGSVDLETGQFSLLSGSERGDGPLLVFPNGVTLQDDKGKVLVSTDLGIVEVDPATGDRERISEHKAGTGEQLSLPYGISYDSIDDRLYFVDYGHDEPVRILGIDLTTGERALVSEGGVRGEGEIHTDPGDIEVHNANGTLWGVADNAVMQVEIASGDRKVISGDGIGKGTAFSGFLEGVALDEINNRVLVLDRGIGLQESRLFAVSMADGSRTILSGQGVGSGPVLDSVVGLEISPDAEYALVTGGHGTVRSDDDRIYRVDLATGDRKLVASLPSDGFDVTFNTDASQAYVLTDFGLLSVDVETGDTNIVSGRANKDDMLVGRGPMENAGHWFGSHLAYDEERNVIYLAVLGPHSIIAIDPVSGDRVIIAN